RWSVVRPIAGHSDQVASGLFAANALELGFGCGLGDEVVNASLSGNRRSCLGIVARDHNGPDSHLTKLCKPLLDTSFDDILELDHSEDVTPVSHHQWGTAGTRDLIHHLNYGDGEGAT